MTFESLRLWTLSGLVPLPFVVVATACSSSGVGSTAQGDAVPVEQLGQRYAEKVCGAIATCCSQNGFAEEHKRCTDIASAIQADIDKDRNRAPGITYDAQRAGNCLAQLAAAYATCSEVSDESADCKSILSGNKPAGAECERSTDCSAGMTCTGRTSTSSADGGTTDKLGTCVRTKIGAPGDPCLVVGGDSVDSSKTYGNCAYSKGLYCDPESKTCKSRGGPGTDCGVSPGSASYTSLQRCNEATFCNSDSKKCEARHAPGESCRTAQSSVSADVCVKDAYCDVTLGECVAKKAAGEACDTKTGNAECLFGCDRTSGKCQANDIDRDVCAGEDK